jgi:hypothetical protein
MLMKFIDLLITRFEKIQKAISLCEGNFTRSYG